MPRRLVGAKVTIEGKVPFLFSVGEDGEPQRNDKGHLVLSSVCIKAAMKEAAKKLQHPTEPKKSADKLVEDAVWISPDVLSFQTAKHIHHRLGRTLGHNKASIAVRPMLSTWELTFEVISKDERLGIRAIRSLLDRAGEYVGLGNYRPDFGRNRVVKFQPFERTVAA